MATHLILFGAGASYGCAHARPSRPPLGTQLFDSLATTFPETWGHFSTALESAFRSNFETGMGQMWDSGTHVIPVLMQQMAVFFAQYGLPAEPIDSYTKLLLALERRNRLSMVIFSTLNYECLLEIALGGIRRSVEYFPTTTSVGSAATVLKLHGSCNFLPAGGLRVTRSGTYGPGARLYPKIEPVGPEKVAAFCSSDTNLYPLMAIYARGKPVQIAPDVLLQIQQHWVARVEAARTIIIVGVNPNPDDHHIWDHLASAAARMYFVGNELRFLDWRDRCRQGRPSHFLGSEFDGAIEGIADVVHS